MNRIIILIFAISLLVTSCQKELIQDPTTSKTSDKFYTNEKEVEEAVNAAYATLQFEGNFNTGIPAMGELPGEDAYDGTPANDGGVYGQLDNFNVTPQNNLIKSIWQDAYKGIQRANIVLNRITNITFKNPKTKQSRIGEMEFIRALYYFNLVRIFGDVPLVTEEVDDTKSYFSQARTPKDQVYDQIKADLNDAISKLPQRGKGYKGRVVKTAAQALLGKVELTLDKYAEAKTQLLDVVNSGKHKLLDDINEVFNTDNELNDEIIFSVQYVSGLNANSEGSDAYKMFNPTGRENPFKGTKGHGVLKESFYNLYGATDTRKGAYVGILESKQAYSNKIAPPSTVISDAGSDWVVLRYADVLLMLAEIENKLGNQNEAVKYVNQIRKRAGLANYSGANTSTAVFDEIDLQRRLELVWEGHRWFDLLRQGRAQSVLEISNKDKLLMPIPENQISPKSGIGLQQNPGY